MSATTTSRFNRINFLFFLLSLSILFTSHHADAGTIRVGFYDLKPLVFKDEQGMPQGLFIKVLGHVAEKEHWTLSWVHGSWPESLARLNSGEIDLLVSVSYSEERARSLDFNKDAVVTDWGLLYRHKNRRLESVADLAGKRVSVMRTGIYTNHFKKLAEQFDVRMEFVERENYSQIIADVEAERSYAGIGSNLAGLSLESSASVARSGIVFSPIKVMYAVRKGTHPEIIRAIDRHLEVLKADRGSLYYHELERMAGKPRGVIPKEAYWTLSVVVGTLVLAIGFIVILRQQVRSKTRSILEAADQYRCMMQSTTDGFWRVGRDGRLLDVNPCYERLSGYSPGELIGMPVDQLDQIELADAVQQRMKTVIESGFSRFETKHRRKNGTIWDVEVSASYQASNGEMIVFLRDITARKSADDLLKTQRDKFEIIFEQSLAGYWDWLIQEDTEYLSPSFKSMFGYEDHELPNHPDTWQKLIFPEDLPGVFAVFNRHVASRGAVPYYNEVRYRHKNGSTVWVICTGKVIEWDEQGQPVRMVGCHIDITRRKHAEAALASQNTKLEVLLGISSLPEADVKTVADHVLSSIARLTESGYGFYGFVNEDETVMTIHSWSDEAMQNCSMVDKPGDYPICTSGVWAEAVRRREPLILNSYADAHPAKKGLPEGHVNLTNLMVVPFFSKGRISTVAAVANRTAAYTEHDVAELTAFLTSVQAITDSKRMEHELKLSEERYRLIMESVSVIPWEFNIPENRWTYVGPQVTELLGYTPEEWTTLEWWLEIIHPEDQTWVPAYCADLTSRGEEHSMEYRLRAKDGSFTWVNDIVTVEMLDGKPHIMRGVMVDISERKSSEEKERLNEKRLKTLVSVLQYPAETIQGFLDNALEEALTLSGSQIGYIYFYHEDRQEFELYSWSSNVIEQCKVLNPQTRYQLDKTGFWGEAVRQGRPIMLNDFAAEHPLKKGYPEGHVHLERFMSIPVVSGNRIVAVAGVGNKSTDYDDNDALQLTLLMDSVWKYVENRRGEVALREHQILFETIVESAAEAIFAKDSSGVYKFINEAGARMLGYKTEDFIGRTDEDLFPTETASEFRKTDEHVMVSGQNYEREEHGVIDGKTRVFLAHKTPWRDDSGEIIGVIGVTNDITERKQAEQEKAKLEEQLHQAQKIESVGRLAGGVAHDFNNMLGVILGHTQLALMETDQNQPLHANLAEIRLAAERSADLTRQLLAFARKQTIAPKLLDLNDTVAGMLKMLQRLIGEDVSLTWKPDAGLWPVKIDPSQIDQILANLCVNARDSLTDNGSIAIETDNRTIDEHYAHENPDATAGDYVALTVSDNGCGMDKDTMTHIFEPFFTTKGVGEGTGLGLATVYGAVKQNGGFITVYSEPGLGTKFTIHIPRHAGQGVQADGGQTEKPFPRGSETILLVEDEPAILKMASILLTKQGYTVLKAQSPAEAAELGRESAGEISLLMTDVVMPEMNGRDLAKQLQAIHPNLRTLFMSGYTADVIAHHGVLDDGVHFIQKPFSLQNMAAKVREVLDSKSGTM